MRHDIGALSESDGQEKILPLLSFGPHNNLLAKLFECLSSRFAVLFTICQINSRSCSYRVYIGHIYNC